MGEINGGTAAITSTHRREVGHWGGCTGTVVRRSGSGASSSRWVLTAGHCNDYHEYSKLSQLGGNSGAIGFFASTNGTSERVNAFETGCMRNLCTECGHALGAA